MDMQRWRRISVIFDQVVEAPPERHSALLDELCAGDDSMRRELEQLLAADENAEVFDSGLNSARGAAAAEWANAAETPSWQADERIGPWRILRELGRGGMGVVLLAARADGQFEQRAAIKLIKRGMDTDAVQARFLRERQILARLEHPHIARLLDGGITEDGRPYFAMEYVDGEPLLKYCAQCDLGLKQRVKLFAEICAAVQFAHAQLVVHRDIKPSNILVTADGQAKLLDFGIAKLLDDSHGGMTQTFDARHRPLTPAYAAPEQMSGQPVSTATDIYSLGVVLFELLTGKRPYSVRDDANVDDAQRAMETTRPPLASKSVEGDVRIAAHELRGDLDTIIATAMQREPQRRYATVDAFAKDLQRFFSGQPISARRDSLGYRVRKFVGRHRLGVAAATFGMVILIASLVFALWQAREKSRQAMMSQQVTQFLVGIFRGADPAVSRGANVTTQDLLDQGSERLRSDTSVAPAVRARLLQTIATTYSDLGLYDRALPLVDEALELRRGDGVSNPADIAESLDELGRIYRLKADYARAEPLLREALQLRSAALSSDDPARIESLDHLGTLLRSEGDFRAADANFEKAMQLSEQRFGKDATETARYVDDYAANIDDQGKRRQALELYRRALAIREKNLGADDAEVATSLINLGTHLDDTGEYIEATHLLERALKIRRQVYGPAHPLVGFAELALCGVYESVDKLDDAGNLAQDALAIFRRGLPADHPKISESLNMLGILRATRRDFAGAVPLMRETAERYRRTLGEDHPDTLVAENNLAYALLHANFLGEADTLLRSAIARVHNDNGQKILATAHENLATTLEWEGEFAQAETSAAAAVEIVRKTEGDASGNLAVALRVLGTSEALGGHFDSAERHLRQSLELGRTLAAKKIGSIADWEMPMADFLAGRGRCAEALPLLDEAIVWMDKNVVAAPSRPEAELLRGYCRGAPDDVAAVQSARAQLNQIPAVEKDLNPTSRRLLRSEKMAGDARAPPAR
ncbi:MAG: tetratricopeptide repeat protein [Rudaea sp.]